MNEAWHERAVAAIDAANADDPRRVAVGGVERAFELVYADHLETWIRALVPEPSGALSFAARAQHVRRWEIPRSTFPDGRAGYHAWRRRLQDHHVAIARACLEEALCPLADIERVERILRKQGVAGDPEPQAMQDALGLVTLEMQLGELAARLDEPKLIEVLRRTAAKMSPAAVALAGTLELPPPMARVLTLAMAPAGGSSP